MWTHTEAISPLGNLCWVIRVGHSPQKKRVGMTIIENSNLSCQHLWKSQELDTVHCLWMFISVSFTWVIWAICRSNQVLWLLTPSHSEDNHDGGITHLEPDIPECEVKWALGSITTKKQVEVWNSSWAISNPERWCCERATLNMPANLENSAVATGLEKVSFHSNPKERQCQRMLRLLTTELHLFHIFAK